MFKTILTFQDYAAASHVASKQENVLIKFNEILFNKYRQSDFNMKLHTVHTMRL